MTIITQKEFRKIQRKYRNIKLRVEYRPEDQSLLFYTSPLDYVAYCTMDFHKRVLDMIKQQIEQPRK